MPPTRTLQDRRALRAQTVEDTVAFGRSRDVPMPGGAHMLRRMLVSVAIATAIGPTTSMAASDPVVVRAREVSQILATGGLVLYGQPRGERGMRWWRVVDGRRLPARAMPEGGTPSSVGRDTEGRAVVTVTASGRWWTYDIRRDAARRARRPAQSSSSPYGVTARRTSNAALTVRARLLCCVSLTACGARRWDLGRWRSR
jgi:hypothetical protein